jgi:hypothetical protein
MHSKELKILEVLDAIVRQESVRATIDSMVPRVEQKLAQDSKASLAWEAVPLGTYGKKLPDVIRSSWVFVLRARTSTGAERHPNSHQRMMSYKGRGDLQIWNGNEWCSNLLESGSHLEIEKKWLSIPPNVWHQAVVPETNWTVISFHTVPENELVEERTDPADSRLIRQRRYSP